MNHINISDFEISHSISGTYCVSNLEIKKAKNNNTYLKAVLSDASGSIDMVCWEYEEFPIEQWFELISVVGSVGSYHGRPQFIAQSFRFPAEQERKALDLAPLVPAAPICAEKYIERLNSLMDSLTDQSLFFICMDIFDQYWDVFTNIPAAQSLHHAFLHGLLMHTVDTAEMADEAARRRPEIDRDIMIAGSLLHDIGKIHELELSPYTGLVIGYTEKGRLIGHAALGYQMIEEAAKNVQADSHLTARLQHMVLTHHGDPSGKDFRYQSVEADLLRKLDALDSSCEHKLENQRRANLGASAASTLPNGLSCDSDDRDTVDF